MRSRMKTLLRRRLSYTNTPDSASCHLHFTVNDCANPTIYSLTHETISIYPSHALYLTPASTKYCFLPSFHSHVYTFHQSCFFFRTLLLLTCAKFTPEETRCHSEVLWLMKTQLVLLNGLTKSSVLAMALLLCFQFIQCLWYLLANATCFQAHR